MEKLPELSKLIPLLIPIVIIWLGLLIAALVDWSRREKTRGPKWMWLLIILFVSTFGPIIYFLAGREKD